MNSIWLCPSVMCVPAWENPGGVLRELEQCGAALMHCDVMDGVFVPNLMLGTDSIKNLRKNSRLPMDIHLMIDRPEDKLGWFGIAPGDYVAIHVESTNHVQRCLGFLRDMGAHPAVALNPATPLCMIEDVIDDVDMVLLMTVNPGYAGQKLVPQTIGKLARLRKLLDDAGHPDTRIEVDGNVSFLNLPAMRGAGADMFVCGTSSIFHKDGTISENVQKMMEIMGKEG